MTQLRNIHEVKLDIRPNGLLCVPVKINGEGPYPFLLDTGSGGSFTSPSVAEKLQLERLDFPLGEGFYAIVVDFAFGELQLRNQFITGHVSNFRKNVLTRNRNA